MVTLTPIRVRGCRKSLTNKKEVNTAGAESDDGRRIIQSRRPTGRPMLSFDALSTSRKMRTASRVKPTANIHIKKHRELSRLESLPVELLEKIFLCSLEINLPRASPAIAAAVSSERVYRVLIVLSFWADPRLELQNQQSGATTAKILRLVDYVVPLESEERRRLQSSILRCRWCTRDRILAQMPELMRMTIHKYWYDAGFTMDDTSKDSLDRFLEKKEGVLAFLGKRPDGTEHILLITPLLSVTIKVRDTRYWETHQVLGVMTFPDKLLRGDEGFEDDDISYLEMLRHASILGTFHLGRAGKALVNFPRDALHRGIHNALVQHNASALTTLLKLDEYHTRHRIEHRIEESRINTNINDGSHYYFLPPEHFHTAVHFTAHDPTFFQLLLRANAESVPADDPAITQWAMDLQNSDNSQHAAFGRWLLDFMTRLPHDIEAARMDPIREGIFYLGGSNQSVEMGRRYVYDVLGLELGHELSQWVYEVAPEHDVSRPWMDRCVLPDLD